MVLVQRGAAFAGLGCQTCPVGRDGSSTGSNAGGDTPVVLPLDDPAAGLEQVGGKGASLARLAAAGLPVPPGFHVTEDGLQEAILEAVAGIVGDAYERYRSLPTYPT